MVKGKEEKEMMKVHQVIDGPYEHSEFWSLVCLVEYEGGMYEEEIVFDTFNDAYTFMSKMDRSEYPLPYDLSNVYRLN